MVAPLTPKCCDLRDYAYIPMQIGRLKQSRAWSMCKRNPALAFYLMNTWTAAFQSVPAASLENDDLVLADLAMCDDETWARVKDDVLRGWVVCDDGRLYHPVVAEYALEGWLGKVSQRKATAAASARRSGVAFDGKPFDLLLTDARAHLRKINPEARALKKLAKAPQTSLSPLGGDEEEASHEAPDGLTSDNPPNPPDGHPPGPPAGHHPVVQVVHQGESRELRVSPSDKSSGESACARPPAPAASRSPGGGAEIVALPASSRRTKKPETAWPADLALGDADRTFAEERGYRGEAATHLWEAFESRAISKGLTYADWHAAWRNWVLKQIEFDAKAGRPAYAAAGRPRGRPPDV